MTHHAILLTRAQAIVDDCPATVILCDIALGRMPDRRDLERVHEQAAARMMQLERCEAILELRLTV